MRGRTADGLHATVLLTTLALLVSALAAKAASALVAVISAGAPASLLGLWILGTGSDALMALLYAAIAYVVCSRRFVIDRPALARTAQAVLILLAGFLVVYHLLNVHLYQLFGTPLNIRYLAWRGGQAGDILSSVKEEPPWVAGGMVLAALALLPVLLTVGRRRLLGLEPGVVRRRLLRLVLVLALWSFLLGVVTQSQSLRERLGSARHNAALSFTLSSLEVLLDIRGSGEIDIDPFRPTYFDVSSPFPEVEIEPGCPIDRPGRPVRNVVLWIMESWTAQDQQLYGGEQPNTPNLERLAPSTLRFTRYYSPSPVSIKSLFDIYCSMHPYPKFEFITTVNPRIPCDSLTEVLARNGYHNALFHGGNFTYTNKLAFFDGRGFETLMDARSTPDRHKYYTYEWGIADRAIVDHAVAWLDENPRTPFFITFIPIVPHYPYTIPDGATPRFSTKELKSRYHNGVAYLDEQLGRFHDELEKRGLADDTLYIVASDHGQAFYQHPQNRLHANFLYQENTWVPLYMINERLFGDGRTCDRVGSHVDLAPTILDVLSIEAPRRYQGRSLFEPGPPHMAMLSTMYRDKLLGLRDGPYKYVLNQQTGNEELYDLTLDPGEKNNIAHLHEERTAKYREHLLEWRDFQGYLVKNYAAITGFKLVDRLQAMEDLLGSSEAWLEHEGHVRPCDEWFIKHHGYNIRGRSQGWRCQYAEEWMYAGLEHLIVDGTWTACFRLHPPEQGVMRLRMPLGKDFEHMYGRVALPDKSVKRGGKPVSFRFSLDQESWSTVTLPNERGFHEWKVSGSGDTLEVELSATSWKNRTVCLVLDVLP